jgi:hypothetical protein
MICNLAYKQQFIKSNRHFIQLVYLLTIEQMEIYIPIWNNVSYKNTHNYENRILRDNSFVVLLPALLQTKTIE